MTKEEELSKAFKLVFKEIREDEGLYIAYQANIAMSYYDTMKGAGYDFPDLHKLSNLAATRFLDLLLKERE